MHIVHVISSLGYGGAEQLLYDMLNTFDLKKHKHSVVYFRPGHQVARLEKLGVKTYYVKGMITRYDLISLFRLYKLMLKLKPDVIHSALWSANILSRIVGKKLHVPVINDLHGSCHYHGWFRNFLDRLTAHMATKIVAVSNDVKQSYWQAVASKILVTRQAESVQARVQVILNGIDVDRVRNDSEQAGVTREQIGLSDNDFVVGSVGRLKSIKGFDDLLTSFALFVRTWQRSDQAAEKHPKLVIIGDGPDREVLGKRVQSLRIEKHVHFLGYVDNARTHYHLFDCFALSSLSEGLSVALLEALCFKLPVVSTHTSNHHEIIEQGVSGLLVPVGDHKAMAQAFYDIATKPDIAASMGKRGHAVVRENFTLARMAGEYEALYEKVLSKKH